MVIGHNEVLHPIHLQPMSPERLQLRQVSIPAQEFEAAMVVGAAGTLVGFQQARLLGRSGYDQRGPALEAASLPAVVLASNRGLVKRADLSSGAVPRDFWGD